MVGDRIRKESQPSQSFLQTLRGTSSFGGKLSGVLWSTARHHVQTSLEHGHEERLGPECAPDPCTEDAGLLTHCFALLIRAKVCCQPFVYPACIQLRHIL